MTTDITTTTAGTPAEWCGAPVTDAQRRTSMLFASRVLCSKCIDQVKGPQPGERGSV